MPTKCQPKDDQYCQSQRSNINFLITLNRKVGRPLVEKMHPKNKTSVSSPKIQLFQWFTQSIHLFSFRRPLPPPPPLRPSSKISLTCSPSSHIMCPYHLSLFPTSSLQCLRPHIFRSLHFIISLINSPSVLITYPQHNSLFSYFSNQWTRHKQGTL